MSILETIKNALISQFSGAVTIDMIITSLVVSFVIGMFILFIYRKTFSGIVYNRTMCLSMVLLTMITAMVIRTINSNLSLSLGMVGALSIVRFRTAIKEPLDTAFMFWAIAAGIMSGAGLYIVGIIGSIALGLLFYIVYITTNKAPAKYLLVVVYNKDVEETVKIELEKITNKKLKSRSYNNSNICEVTFEISNDKDIDKAMVALQSISGVKNVNLVTYTNDYGM